MDEQKIEKIDDDTVKVSTTTSENIDVSILKQSLTDSTNQLRNFEDWVIGQRIALQANIDEAQSVLDKVAAVGVSTAENIADSHEEIS